MTYFHTISSDLRFSKSLMHDVAKCLNGTLLTGGCCKRLELIQVRQWGGGRESASEIVNWSVVVMTTIQSLVLR